MKCEFWENIVASKTQLKTSFSVGINDNVTSDQLMNDFCITDFSPMISHLKKLWRYECDQCFGTVFLILFIGL